MADIGSIKGKTPEAEGAAKEKVVKFKLTKEQTAYVNDLVRLENRIAVSREYSALWMGYFRFFAEDMNQKEITANDEKAFFQIMTQISRKHFQFVELMGNLIERGNDVITVIATSVSLTHVKALNENTRSKLELDWHNIFLDMNRGLGRLIRQLPGDLPLAQALEKVEKQQPMQPPPAGAGGPSAASPRRGNLTTGTKKKNVAAALAFPLGMFGAHYFYLGKTKLAWISLVTLGGVGVWALWDLIQILRGKMQDATGAELA